MTIKINSNDVTESQAVDAAIKIFEEETNKTSWT